MLKGGAGPLTSFLALFAMPLIGAVLLSKPQFAMFAILNSIATISLSLDFGGVSLVMARLKFERRVPLLIKATALSATGSLLIGLLACVVWIPYSTTDAAQAFDFKEGVFAIGLVGLASTVRSALMVLAQAALNDRLFGLRTFLIAGQAFLFATVTLAVLIGTRSAWSFVVGWLISPAIVLSIGVIWAGRKRVFSLEPRCERSGAERPRTRAVAIPRTAATLIGAVLLQGDRWVVGALGGSAFLGAYEIAWRVAAMPRFLAQELSAVTGSEASVLNTGDSRDQDLALFLQRSLRIVFTFAGASALAMIIAYPVLTHLTGVDRQTAIFLALLVALATNGATAPVTILGIGIGYMTIDMSFLALRLLLTAASAAFAFYAESPYIFIWGNTISTAVLSAGFLVYGPHLIRRRMTKR